MPLGSEFAQEFLRSGGPRPEELKILHKASAVIISLIMSLLCLVSGTILATRSPSNCIIFLHSGLIAIGAALLAMVIMFYCFYRPSNTVVLHLHLFVTFISLLALLALLITAFVHINIKNVDDQPEELDLDDYRGLLRRRVADPGYWTSITGCLRRRHACSGMNPLLVRDSNTGVLLEVPRGTYSERLSPIQSGCCKPPLSCGFTYVNQTTWTVPGLPTNNTNGDCSRWSNDQEKLCFQCDSCRAGFLADVQRAWSKTVIDLTIFTLLDIIGVAISAHWIWSG